MQQKIFVIILALGLLLSACSPASAPSPEPAPATTGISVTDALGRALTLEGPAQKIVSLAPSVTETLFAVGAGSQVVARDSFSDYPPEAQSLADIGGGFGELNTELILSLEPDLVMAAEITPAEQVQALEGLGLTVFVLPNANDFPGLYDVLALAGEITGHQAETQALVDGLKARVSAVEEKVSAVEERPLVFYELDISDPNAPWTSGPGTFIETLIVAAGGQNLGSKLDGAWAQISLEQLLIDDPDLIVLGDATWGGVTPEDVAARAGWETLTAVREGRVYPFDDNLVSRPGPRLVDGLEAMARLLHPGLFE